MKTHQLIVVVTFAFATFSCQPTKTVADTSCPGYKSVDFEREYISKYGIAIMPVLGGDEKEQYRRPMGDEITKHFRDEFGKENIKSPSEVISTLNDVGLADDYANAISLYNTSGIIPQQLLEKIGDVLNTKYILYVKLLADSEIDFIDYGYYGTTRVEVYELYIQTQVWSTDLGDVVWEGKGGHAVYNNQELDLVEKSAKGITNVVGNEKNNGPCESPSEVIKSVKAASMNTIWAISGVSLALSLLVLLI